MAENRQAKSLNLPSSAGSRPSSVSRDDKEARIKSFKERQNEERQRKLDEMKNQALAAQRFKEQKEHERRQRLDELRVKEDERRQQVEERKKAITDAERDRLESILKRNQEREARIEAKRKNERSSLIFAFGSSCPRILGPTESSSSFWGHRRATSIQNITYSPAPLTRRQSEREIDGGSKKRATSAGGIERSGEDMQMSTSMYAVFHWEDERDSSKSSISNYPTQAISSKTMTNFAPLPQHPAGCISGYVGRRRTDLMPTIPAKESPTTPARKPFMRSPAPSRPGSSLSQQSTSSINSSVIMRSRPSATARHPRPASIAVTGITSDTRSGFDLKKPETKPPLPKSKKSQEKIGKKKSPTEDSPKTLLSPTTVITTIEGNSVDMEDNDNSGSNKSFEMSCSQKSEQFKEMEQSTSYEIQDIKLKLENINLSKDEKSDIEKEVDNCILIKTDVDECDVTVAVSQVDVFENQNTESDMTTSVSSKPRITTEEEAKAALAERRRIAREEAEKQAELDRQRVLEELRVEIERQQREEEQQRQLIELQRAAEEERLREAIQETQRREEEERLRREEELRLKILKEEAERKAREEAERQKTELQEKLKNEEKEREARRKRVEAIMLRTRGKNISNSSPQTEEKNVENKFGSKVNGSKTEADEKNGHKNGKEIESVDNIIPVDTIRNANTVNVIALSTDDTLNSNDAWQRNSQTDLLM